MRFAGAKSWGQAIVGGLAVALAIAVFLAPFAYDQPDGLEFVGEKLALLPRRQAAPRIPAPDPRLPASDRRARHVKVATAAAGLVGTLVVFGVAWGMARILPRPKQIEAHSRCGLRRLECHGERTGLLAAARCPAQVDRGPGFVVVAVATPIGSWNWLGVEGFVLAFVIGLAGIPPRDLARRWLAFLVLVGFLALLVAPTHPARARYGLGVVVVEHPDQEQSGAPDDARACRSRHRFTSSWRHCASWAFRSCWSPRLQFMERTAMCSSTSSTRMATARRARTFNRRGRLSWSLLGGLDRPALPAYIRAGASGFTGRWSLAAGRVLFTASTIEEATRERHGFNLDS